MLYFYDLTVPIYFVNYKYFAILTHFQSFIDYICPQQLTERYKQIKSTWYLLYRYIKYLKSTNRQLFYIDIQCRIGKKKSSQPYFHGPSKLNSYKKTSKVGNNGCATSLNIFLTVWELHFETFLRANRYNVVENTFLFEQHQLLRLLAHRLSTSIWSDISTAAVSEWKWKTITH